MSDWFCAEVGYEGSEECCFLEANSERGHHAVSTPESCPSEALEEMGLIIVLQG